MTEIVPSLIWLANGLEVRDLKLIADTQIEAIVDVAYEETPATSLKSILVFRIPLIDGEGNEPRNIRLAIATTIQLIQTKTRFVIACSAGISRSPTILAASLADARATSIEEQLKLIKAKKRIGVSTAFLNEVKNATAST